MLRCCCCCCLIYQNVRGGRVRKLDSELLFFVALSSPKTEGEGGGSANDLGRFAWGLIFTSTFQECFASVIVLSFKQLEEEGVIFVCSRLRLLREMRKWERKALQHITDSGWQ